MSAPISALLGGVEVTVTKVDGSTEVVKVRQLPIKDLPRYLVVYEDESGTIGLFCGRGEAWVSDLDPASAELIIQEGEKLNLDFLARHVTRKIARREKLAPGMTDKIIQMAVSALQKPAPDSPAPQV